jgi:hypothetical protein
MNSYWFLEKCPILPNDSHTKRLSTISITKWPISHNVSSLKVPSKKDPDHQIISSPNDLGHEMDQNATLKGIVSRDSEGFLDDSSVWMGCLCNVAGGFKFFIFIFKNNSIGGVLFEYHSSND